MLPVTRHSVTPLTHTLSSLSIQEIVLGYAVTIRCGDQSISLQSFIQEFFRLYTRFIKELAHLRADRAEFIKYSKRFLEAVDESVTFFDIHEVLPIHNHSEDRIVEISANMTMMGWSNSELILAPLAKMVERNSVLRRHLSTLQLATARFKATDPRDKIYALINIILPSDSLRRIVPDYTKSTAAVFAEATALTISENFQAAYQFIPLHLCRDRIPGLPSWVPNMSINFVPKDVDEMRELGMPYPESTIWTAHCPIYYLPDTDTLQTALNNLAGSELHRELHPHNTTTFSDDYKILHTVGSVMGTVAGILEIPHHPATASDPNTIKQSIARLRQFFIQHDISVRHALSTIFGSPGHPYTPTPTQTTAFDILLNPSVELEYILIMPGGWGSVIDAVVGRTLFVTDTGCVGKSMGGVEVGDALVGLFGIMLPFVLRKASEGGREGGGWRMVNVAHVAEHGLEVFGDGRDGFSII
jgi:hypothetical protein